MNKNHWIVVSTSNLKATADIIVYDSLYSSVNMETQVTLAQLLHTEKDTITVQLAKVNKQSDTYDCGAFAIAYCTRL